MKRTTFIIALTLLVPLAGIGQNQSSITDDDIYFKPSDAKIVQKARTNKETPNYKNGAKEIIYVDRENNKSVTQDTAYVLAQANDSTENYEQQGEYLNGFNGTQSDLEYAERIRRFHNPRYTIHIGDPNYNDIYFLNNSDWNVYVDGTYAYVTPTWTNPYWWNYNYSPYSSWGWGGYGGYYGWNNYPWSFNNYYGWGGYYGYGGFGFGLGFGYGGYYGYGGYWDYPYYGYGGWGGYGYTQQNPAHNEANRRANSSAGSSRLDNGGSTSRVSGGYNGTTGNPYTTISGTGSRAQSTTGTVAQGVRSTSVGSRSTTTDYNGTRSSYSRGNGIGAVRSSTGSRSVINNSSYTSRAAGSSYNAGSYINTQPRTLLNSNQSNYNSVNSSSRSSYSSQSPSRSSYSTGTTARSSYSTGTPARSSSYSTSSSYSGSSRSSSPSSYSSSSNSSYSSGSSSSSGGGGSRSSGGSSGGSSSGSRR